MTTVIPKQPPKERDQITIRLDRDVLQTLEHYCRYLESSRDYMIDPCLTFIFRKGRRFEEWLATAEIVQSAVTNGATPEPSKPVNSKLKCTGGQARLAVSECSPL